MHQTTLAKPSTVRENWILVDATNLPVGRLATRVALALQGKNKPEYTENIDTGDYVIIVNAEKVAISGNKQNDKVYRHHTLYPGGLKEISYERMQDNHPERIIELAIRRMMPKTKMGKKMMKKLHIYVGGNHPHVAQSPAATDLINQRSV
jgi:large subunit ribosomal protein L13